jgi:LCP family protein required for cell wall assembly
MKKKIAIGVILAFSAVVLYGVLYGYSFLNKIDRGKLPKSKEELGIKEPENKDEGNSKVEESKDDVTNIALFGVDARKKGQSTRSDVIMVLSIDRKNNKIKVSSIMRDLYVDIPGKGKNKINAAYAFGGAPLAVKTLNTLFDLNVRNYVTVDFFGMEKLVDKIGGVDVNIKESEIKVLNNYLVELNKLNGDEPDYNFIEEPGVQRLTGRQAVAYSRIRYVGNADYERTERQRRVLNEIYKKVKAQGITKLTGTLSEILPYVETSLSNNEIIGLAFDVIKINTENLDEYRIPVDGCYKPETLTNGMQVLTPDIPLNKAKLHEFIYETK